MFLVLVWLTFREVSCVYPDGPTAYFYNVVLANYSNDVPPWDRTGEQVVMNFSTPFVVLANLEENTQLVSFIAKISVNWVDPRLRFNATKAGREVVTVPTTKLWMPTFEVYNSQDVIQADQPQIYFEAEVKSTGIVSILWKGRFDVICELALDNFPFDTQSCSISFSCGLSPVEALMAHAMSSPTDFLVGNSEWDISALEVVDFLFESLGKNQSLARIGYSLKRNPQFYVYFLVVPTFIITTTCLIALLFPFKMTIGEKLNLCLAGLLGLTFMLGVIVQELPRCSTMPLLGKWLLLQMFFCIFGLLGDIPNAYVRKRYPKHPRKSRLFAVGIMAIILLAQCLSSVLMFTAIPPDPDPASYKQL